MYTMLLCYLLTWIRWFQNNKFFEYLDIAVDMADGRCGALFCRHEKRIQWEINASIEAEREGRHLSYFKYI